MFVQLQWGFLSLLFSSCPSPQSCVSETTWKIKRTHKSHKSGHKSLRCSACVCVSLQDEDSTPTRDQSDGSGGETGSLVDARTRLLLFVLSPRCWSEMRPPSSSSALSVCCHSASHAKVYVYNVLITHSTFPSAIISNKIESISDSHRLSPIAEMKKKCCMLCWDFSKDEREQKMKKLNWQHVPSAAVFCSIILARHSIKWVLRAPQNEGNNRLRRFCVFFLY